MPGSESRQAREPGLRERKKARVRHAIEVAALRSVLELGYEEATVELICREADISKKTFFNYFSSKDAALLGERRAGGSSDDLVRQMEERADAPYLDVIAEYVSGALYPRSDDQEIMRLRSQVLVATPQLAFRSKRGMVNVNKLASDGVRCYLEAHPERRAAPELPLDMECVIAVSTALNIARTRYLFAMCGGQDLSVAKARGVVHGYLEAL